MSVLQHHNCLLPFSKAASCPPLPQINKASVSKYTTEEMRLEDGHVVGNSTCVGVNSWSRKDVMCSRKYL